MDFLQQTYSGIIQLFNLSLHKMIVIAVLITGGLLIRNLFSKGVLLIIKRFISKHKGSMKEEYLVSLMKPISFLFLIGAFYIAGIVADFPVGFLEFYRSLLKTFVTFTFFWGVFSLIAPIAHMTNKQKNQEINSAVRDLLSRFSEIIVVILGVLAIMKVWGVDVSAFLAGLGILGMAVGFAAKDTIQNFFGCIAILMDKTFQKGHWIKTPNVEGVVEFIGFRTTAIRQFDKALVHIPNAKLADAAIINFAKRTNRRIHWIIGLTYGTSAEALERIVKRIKEYLEENPDIETDPRRVTTLINVDKFSDSSIDIYCYFFTKTIDWKDYMDIKEQCVLTIKRIVEEEGSSFAFPTQSLHIESVNMGDAKPQEALHKKTSSKK